MREVIMTREQSMQRLNVLTLLAVLIGICAFIYDATTPSQARTVANGSPWADARIQLTLDAPGDSEVDAAGVAVGLD
jgi:hypothetical protein